MQVADVLAVRKKKHFIPAGNYSEVGQSPTKGAMHKVTCVTCTNNESGYHKHR